MCFELDEQSPRAGTRPKGVKRGILRDMSCSCMMHINVTDTPCMYFHRSLVVDDRICKSWEGMGVQGTGEYHLVIIQLRVPSLLR